MQEGYSVENGALTIDVDGKSAVRAENGGVVNFSGDTVKMTGDGSAGSIVSSVYVDEDSSVNFNNSDTFINGFYYAGLRLESGSSLISNNLTINNDRTPDTANTDKYGYGVIQDSSDVTVKGTANISLKAGSDDAGAYGMYIFNSSNAVFKKRAEITAEGGAENAMGLVVDSSNVTFKNGAAITAKNSSQNIGVSVYGTPQHFIWDGLIEVTASGADGTSNQGMIIDDASFEMGETVIEVSGGDTAGGLELANSEAAFNGNLTIKATESVASEALDVQSSTFTAGNVSVTAQGSSRARGFYVDGGGSAELSGGLTAFADGGAGGSTALEVQGSFSALFGNITAEGEESKGISSQAG